MPPAKVSIVIYSLYHHVYKLALEVHKGLEVAGVQSKIYQVQETLTPEVLALVKAPSPPDLPIATNNVLVESDGVMFGFPTRFGGMPTQMRAFLDGTGGLWAKGALHGKFAATFFSTASQHGGQETTALTSIPYFAHHGMIYVPYGFTNPLLSNNAKVIGGSPYGAGTIAGGDGSRQPIEEELSIARSQGEHFGRVVSTFLQGKHQAKL
ncbi:NAD(P)H:quinone oxidoreductase, type IV [Dichotomocladium elegans]|nr:NAD(P)H:quinone oxidoreductase, type IV [Dichotomocladium elegans]